MRLYFARGTSSLATRIVLLECGLPFEETEITKVMMREGGDFRTINPLGYVPALTGFSARISAKVSFATSSASRTKGAPT